MGFEPTEGFPTLDFESSALNRTQPPFQSSDIVRVISGRAIAVPRVCKGKAERFNDAMDITLTDGGIETRISVNVAAVELLRRALRRYASQGGDRLR